MTPAQIAGKMTPHQRWALVMLVRRATPPVGLPLGYEADHASWVLAKDCGAPAAMERFVCRGLVDRKVEIGPRGGEHVSYRPTEDGFRARDYIVGHDLKRG